MENKTNNDKSTASLSSWPIFFTEGHNFEPANRKQEFSAHEVGPGTKNVGAETTSRKVVL